MAAGRAPREFDAPETQIAFGNGANITELAQMFEMERRDVTKKLARGDLKPVGRRNGHPVFSVKEAARLLVLPSNRVVAQVLGMHHYQLPPMLKKEYWAARKLRQGYLVEREDLWSTARVASYMGEAFQQIRMALLLLPDALARRSQLTEAQRDVLNTITDGVLTDARERLVNSFKAKKYAGDHGDDEGSFSGYFVDVEADAGEDAEV